METLKIHSNVYDKLDTFYNNNNIPNIIFHGASGSGKKTILYNFLNKIYNNDKSKLKTNVMIVNCAHGKGIKFIRDEVKFFAKTNLQHNVNIKFKTIILLNADSLTNDAQSALRRCIELFSYNTRFFIVVENKDRLLKPILSRFCDIHIPEYIVNKKIVNLHKIYLDSVIDISKQQNEKKIWFIQNLPICKYSHKELIYISSNIYEEGYSCLDLMDYIQSLDSYNKSDKSNFMLCFHKVKSKFKNEKFLILYMLDFIFIRQDKSIHNI